MTTETSTMLYCSRTALRNGITPNQIDHRGLTLGYSCNKGTFHQGHGQLKMLMVHDIQERDLSRDEAERLHYRRKRKKKKNNKF